MKRLAQDVDGRHLFATVTIADATPDYLLSPEELHLLYERHAGRGAGGVGHSTRGRPAQLSSDWR